MSARTIVRDQPTRAVRFVCAKCGGDRDGDVITQEVDDAVRCRTCAYTSDLGVLDIPTTDQLETMLFDATVAAAVLLVRATAGEHQRSTAQRAVDSINTAALCIDGDRFAHELATMPPDVARAHLSHLRRELTQFGRQGFLHRISTMTVPGSSMTATQRDVVSEIGMCIGLASRHVNGIIAVAYAPALV